MSYGGINYDYDYRDSGYNNRDRTSWLRDNFLRPRYDAPLSQKSPAHFNTKAGTSETAEVLITAATQLFPRHEASSGRTVFGTIAPSKLRGTQSDAPQVPWHKMAQGLPDGELRCPMAIPPPDARPFVPDVEGSIKRQVACLHGRNVDSFSTSSNFAPW